MNPIIQCVPNFSEGKNPRTVEAIVDAARRASGARLVDYSFDPDHNRLVVTLLGGPEEIRQAAFASAETAVDLIDMRGHTGAHPRIGAVDVVPLVPVRGITMRECVDLSYEVGRDIAEKLCIPVYFYERSAVLSHRTNLADIRRGGYERLCTSGLEGDRAPDLGPCRVHPTAGATVVGARGPLVAYNVNLDSRDMEVAQAIVRKIRSGEAGLQGVKSMSVWLAAKSKAQVSMNITKPDATTIRDVYRFVAGEARKLDVAVAESEIIGVVPGKYLDGTSPEELKATHFKESQVLDAWL
ncbi:MAG TPA: glutamate formimidoyltransferase [Armatimonadota bacterium]|nr:glutamate formimidoyltransferase [Armatimonadota bacterium]